MTKKPGRLLLLSGPYSIGGAERIACRLAHAFRERGWETRLMFPARAKESGLIDWCRAQGVEAEADARLFPHDGPYTREYRDGLREIVRGWSPDVVNIHYGDNYISLNDVLAVRAGSAGRRCRVIATVNHPTPWDESNARKRKMTRLAALLCDRVIVISDATRRVVQEAGVAERRIARVPCGIEPPRRTPDRAAARAALGLPPDAYVVGCTGRLVGYKRVDRLIEAVGRLPDAGPEVRLIVAGKGPELDALRRLADERLPGRADLPGYVADLDAFYAACDVLCLPSEMEGFGLVFAEAAFHGVPSVGTNVGGVPDAITDGRTGLLVPVGDVDALTAALACLRDEPARRAAMGEAARKRALAEFTEGTMADRYAAVFAGGRL